MSIPAWSACSRSAALDGNLPVVTEKRIPIRNMMLQYNFVFDRAGGSAQLNNPNWPQFVSTIVPPKDGELAKGTYRPLLTPVNFTETSKGTRYTDRLVRRPALDQQPARRVPVHPDQPAELHGGRRPDRPGHAGRSRRCPTRSATCSSR